MLRRVLAVAFLFPCILQAQGTVADYERAEKIRELRQTAVYRDRISAYWSKSGDRLWYAVWSSDAIGKRYAVDLVTGIKSEIDKSPPEVLEQQEAKFASIPTARTPTIPYAYGKYHPSIEDDNLWIVEQSTGKRRRMTYDGTTDHFYEGPFYFSPDGTRLVCMKSRKPDAGPAVRKAFKATDRIELQSFAEPFAPAGCSIRASKPHLFNLEEFKELPLYDSYFRNPAEIRNIHWKRDSSRFFFDYIQRGGQVCRVLAVDADTGVVVPVVNEEPKTFFDAGGKYYCRHVEKTDELIWMSEQNGWNHLYLVDRRTGRQKAITSGKWAVRRAMVDEEERRIYFTAGGIREGQDPYQLHLCRVNFEGTGLMVLTEEDGDHEVVSSSPDGKYMIVSHSRPDKPPVTELRWRESGRKIAVLETSDDSELRKAGWRPPERFAAKGRDGKTDIYGLIHWPSWFDPTKKYPVLEYVYAGPHDCDVPKSFRSNGLLEAFAELGFIVVQSDGMGTSHRSKEFHDVCWKNLGDAGFPDRIAWIKAAATRFPGMDLTKVGIFGGSAGGQNAVRALIAHNDFYKAAAADCGCHDNRHNDWRWAEQYMSWPIGDHYKESSNIEQAHRLKGKVLLTVGERDDIVDPASTAKLASVLIKAGKDVELISVPGAGHGTIDIPSVRRRTMDFFVRSLMGVEPRAK